jgi:hypothetical protein
MTITADFKNLVLQRLIKLPFGQDIPLKTQDPLYPDTMEAIKIIIDWKQDRDHGFIISFNNQFTHIRKSDEPTKRSTLPSGTLHSHTSLHTK